MSVHEESYTVYIGRSAGRTRLHLKVKSQFPLPSPEDVKLFLNYIIERGREAKSDLDKKGFSYHAWIQLAKSELARVITFNRRRINEVARMSLELYTKRTSLDEEEKSP